MGLLAAEMTARTGRDPGELYRDLTRELGDPVYERIDARGDAGRKGGARAAHGKGSNLRGAGWRSGYCRSHRRRPDDGRPIGGIKVVTEHGWFAARPSGTEAVYKLYAESWRNVEHLRRIQEEAQAIIARVLRTARPR